MNTLSKLLRVFATLLILAVVTALSSCGGSSDDTTLLGDWYKKSDLEGVGRSGAVSVVLDGKAYVGTGFDGTKWLTDWWQYDATRDFWQKQDPFPGAARTAAVAFEANGKAYVGTGYADDVLFNDFYEFDPTVSPGQGLQWRKVADYLGGVRYGAVAFSLNNTGYVGTGYNEDNYLKDMWKYVPAAGGDGAWTQVVSVTGSKRAYAFSFVIGNKAYVGGGQNNNVLQYDLLEYDAEHDSWTAKLALNDDTQPATNISRQQTVSFVINGLAYLVGGISTSIDNQVWQYDPTTDIWLRKTDFEGYARENAVGFSIGDRGYVTTGRNSSARYDDIYQFDPLAVDVD
jgi:N-acetylneuraminic acid mutarotase